VTKTAIDEGMARPAERPRQTVKSGAEKEDSVKQSQKMLLTALTTNPELFAQIQDFIRPEDFTTDLYRQVAEMLYRQYEKGALNPAAIMDSFTEEEVHREVASLFYAEIKELHTKQEQEKAWKDIVLKVKKNSIEEASRKLSPTDMKGLQMIMESRRKLQDLEALHISVN
jgi:DNA primase